MTQASTHTVTAISILVNCGPLKKIARHADRGVSTLTSLAVPLTEVSECSTAACVLTRPPFTSCEPKIHPSSRASVVERTPQKQHCLRFFTEVIASRVLPSMDEVKRASMYLCLFERDTPHHRVNCVNSLHDAKKLSCVTSEELTHVWCECRSCCCFDYDCYYRCCCCVFFCYCCRCGCRCCGCCKTSLFPKFLCPSVGVNFFSSTLHTPSDLIIRLDLFLVSHIWPVLHPYVTALCLCNFDFFQSLVIICSGEKKYQLS